MVKKLVAVGCSYTENNYSFPVWPELLSKEYNYKCINLGNCGSGNEYIFSNALDASIKEAAERQKSGPPQINAPT